MSTADLTTMELNLVFTGLHLRQGQIPAIHVYNYVTLEVHAILDTVCVIMCVCMYVQHAS